MIVTFCGHSDYQESRQDEEKIMALLEELVGDQPAELFLGGYGFFDAFACRCGQAYQKTHPHTRLVFVTPYITEAYQRNHLDYAKSNYDEIIYPPPSSMRLSNMPFLTATNGWWSRRSF